MFHDSECCLEAGLRSGRLPGWFSIGDWSGTMKGPSSATSSHPWLVAKRAILDMHANTGYASFVEATLFTRQRVPFANRNHTKPMRRPNV